MIPSISVRSEILHDWKIVLVSWVNLLQTNMHMFYLLHLNTTSHPPNKLNQSLNQVKQRKANKSTTPLDYLNPIELKFALIQSISLHINMQIHYKCNMTPSSFPKPSFFLTVSQQYIDYYAWEIRVILYRSIDWYKIHNHRSAVVLSERTC